MSNPFIQFSIILLIILVISFVMRLLKQPLIMGYILSGIVVGPIFLNLIEGVESINTFSEMGIAFLLFIVGLHLSPRVIKEVGKVSVITGLGQIIFTSLIGYYIGIILGFSVIASLYIAIALTFSSTIIIMKLLSDKDALEKLYGKISIGFLLVQDFVAILILVIVSSFAVNSNVNLISSTIITLIKGTALVIILAVISYYILPKLNTFFSRSQEFLFIFSITWGFGIALLFIFVGLTIEVGALIAGVLLSVAPYSYEVSSRLKSLRDFFIIFFFLILGSQMVFNDISILIVPAIIFSLFILIGNPLIVMALMGVLGYSKKTGFMAGLTVAQISEFSLILIALGVKIGQLTQDILSFVTLIGLITIAGSTYMINYSEVIYNKISKWLDIFERKKLFERHIPKKSHKYVLLGYHRVGFSILKAFSKITKNFLIVDYNPEVVHELKTKKFDAVYGDAEDAELLGELGISKASVIVSTIPESEANLVVLEVAKKNRNKPIVIVTARQSSEAIKLYDAGADYVILPHFLGGEYVAQLIEKGRDNYSLYEKEKNKDLKILRERLKEKQLRIKRHKKLK